MDIIGTVIQPYPACSVLKILLGGNIVIKLRTLREVSLVSVVERIFFLRLLRFLGIIELIESQELVMAVLSVLGYRADKSGFTSVRDKRSPRGVVDYCKTVRDKIGESVHVLTQIMVRSFILPVVPEAYLGPVPDKSYILEICLGVR